MKKQLIKYFLLALCLMFCAVSISKTIRSSYKTIRADYFQNGKGRGQHFITLIIQ